MLVGVSSIADLGASILDDTSLNGRLQEYGKRPFTDATLQALREAVTRPDIAVHLGPLARYSLEQRLAEEERRRKGEEDKREREERWRVDAEFRRILRRTQDKAPRSPRTVREAKLESAKPELVEEETRKNELEGAMLLEARKRDAAKTAQARELKERRRRMEEARKEEARKRQERAAQGQQTKDDEPKAPPEDAPEDHAEWLWDVINRHKGGAELPKEYESMGPWEQLLDLQSAGSLDLQDLVARRRPPPAAGTAPEGRVSVVVPTMERRQLYHAQLWSIFNAQLWADKELIVVETYDRMASPFFKKKAQEDDRIVYVAFPFNLPLGLKRNICTRLATGTYIANFDDDDLYAPNYLSTMVSAMLAEKCNAITLGSWFEYDVESGTFGHFDPVAVSTKAQQADDWAFGYGFSYLFTRAIALRVPYTVDGKCEDHQFFQRVRRWNKRRAGDVDTMPQPLERAGIALYSDVQGICLHTLHDGASSACAPDASSHTELPEDLVGALAVADLNSVYSTHTRRVAKKATRSRFIRGRAGLRHQTLRVHCSQGELPIKTSLGATMGDVRKLVERQLQAKGVELYSKPPPGAQGEQLALEDSSCASTAAPHAAALETVQLEDSERLRLCTGDLWALLPIEKTVSILLADLQDCCVQATVELPNAMVKVEEVLPALVEQHGGRNLEGFNGFPELTGLRIAKMSKWLAFFAPDPAAEVGAARTFFVYGLARLLARGCGPEEESHRQLGELRRRIFALDCL